MRLTNAIKEEIIDNAIESADIPNRSKALEVIEHKLAERALITRFGGKAKFEVFIEAEATFMELSKKHDVKHYRNHNYSINVQSTSGDHYTCLSLSEGRYTPTGALQLDIGSPLMKSIIKWDKDVTALKEEKSTIQHEVMTILKSVTTVKQLLKVWPEAIDLIPEQEKPTQLPVVATDDLNKRLSLPKVTK